MPGFHVQVGIFPAYQRFPINVAPMRSKDFCPAIVPGSLLDAANHVPHGYFAVESTNEHDLSLYNVWWTSIPDIRLVISMPQWVKVGNVVDVWPTSLWQYRSNEFVGLYGVDQFPQYLTSVSRGGWQWNRFYYDWAGCLRRVYIDSDAKNVEMTTLLWGQTDPRMWWYHYGESQADVWQGNARL